MAFKFGPYILILLFLQYACQPKAKIENDRVSQESSTHFQISQKDNYQLLEVDKPFVGGEFKERYVLYPKGAAKPELDNITHYIETPVERIGITSTTHLAFLNELDALKRIKAATNLDLYYNLNFKALIALDSVKSIGAQGINQESVVSSNLEVVFDYAIDMQSYKGVQKNRKLNQNVILISEFMEGTPLDKLQWLSVFALFLGEEAQQMADSIIQTREEQYEALIEKANKVTKESEVMIGFPWQGNWFVSGGESFQARYFSDASANYIWKDLKQEASVPLTIEKVIHDALEADLWINPGIMQSKKQMLEIDQRFSNFKAFKNNRIYSNYKRSNELGANDYWESGVVHPEYILADLIKIQYPELLEAHELYYYYKLEE